MALLWVMWGRTEKLRNAAWNFPYPVFAISRYICLLLSNIVIWGSMASLRFYMTMSANIRQMSRKGVHLDIGKSQAPFRSFSWLLAPLFGGRLWISF